MVFVDPKNLGYTPYWEKWLKNRPIEQVNELGPLYKKYVYNLVELVVEAMQDGQPVERLRTILPITNLNLVNEWINM